MRPIDVDAYVATVQLTRDEMIAIANAFTIVRGHGPQGYGVPGWEFHTLIGIQPQEADGFSAQLQAVLDQQSERLPGQRSAL